MLVLDQIFPEGIRIPDYFFGKNIVHLPTVKCHIYTTTTGAMKNAFGGLLNDPPALHALLDPRDAGRPAGHPEGDPPGPLRGHGRHHRRQRPRAADDDAGGEERHAGLRRPGGHRRRRGQDDGLRPADASTTSAWRTRTGWASATRARSRSSATSTSRASAGASGRRQPGPRGWVTCSGSGRSSPPEAVLPHAARAALSRPRRSITTTFAGRCTTARSSSAGVGTRPGGTSSIATRRGLWPRPSARRDPARSLTRQRRLARALILLGGAGHRPLRRLCRLGGLARWRAFGAFLPVARGCSPRPRRAQLSASLRQMGVLPASAGIRIARGARSESSSQASRSP